FITADLLGGKQVLMVGNLIYSQFLTARDWPFGSALSFFLIAIMLLLLLFIQAMLARRAQGARHA
ncbi:MAG TPA: ABC transporter permease, partial [Pseudomonas sp.]|nr:ABC transporter permease [Pseudomonas sp.]